LNLSPFFKESRTKAKLPTGKHRPSSKCISESDDVQNHKPAREKTICQHAKAFQVSDFQELLGSSAFPEAQSKTPSDN
jgi:hypothetical protein